METVIQMASNKDLQKQIDELKEYIKKFEDNMNC